MRPKPFEKHKRPSNIGLIAYATFIVVLSMILLVLFVAIGVLCARGGCL